MRIVLIAALIGSALASAHAQTAPPTTIANLIPPPGLEATCLANGTYYRQGTRVCVRSAYGPQVATCGRAENLVKWEFSGAPCQDAAPRP